MTNTKTTLARHQKDSSIFLTTGKKVAIILIIGLLLSVGAILFINRTYTNALIQRAEAFAYAITPADTEKLKDVGLSDDEVPYAEVKAQLANLKQVYPETRFVYLMNRTPEGVSFLADSEPADSTDSSARNSAYPEASGALKAIFDNKTAFVEGPSRDSYGIWYSAVAPVLDSSGEVTAAIGLDVPVASYLSLTIGMGLVPLAIAIIGAIAIRFYDAARRRRTQATRLQVELASVASHELAAPLKGIRWGEESILKEKDQLSEEHQKLAQVIYDSTLRLQKSVDNILQLASLAADDTKQPPAVPVELGRIVREAIDAEQLPAQEKNVPLIQDEGWPEIYARGDTTRLRSAFIGIIATALDTAGEQGRVTFAYALPGEQHVITIKVEGAKSGEVIDAGLDLPRTILTQYDGELQAEASDTTAIFRVILPVTAAPSVTMPTSAAS